MNEIRPEERVLDWHPEHDIKSLDYPIRSALPASLIRKVPKSWQEGVVLDQGREGACVGYGWAAELLAEPFAPKTQPSALAAQEYATLSYRRAQKIDQWPGEDYEGTSVLAGAKIMQQDNQISGYRWAFGMYDIRDTVITLGPVVIGIPWYSGMYRTKPDGTVVVAGEKVGGHCVVITGYHPEYLIDGKHEEVFRWRNSWGPSYGINGSGYIKYRDLQQLIHQNAELCIPVGRKTPRFDLSLN